MATGSDIIQVAKKHIGEKYILGTLVPKDNPNWKGPWDCAEFASWCVYQVSNTLYGCVKNNVNPSKADSYTGAWDRDAKKLGQMISLEEAIATPGAAILRIPLSGRMGHIVFSDGNGHTIEAHSSTRGVIKSTVKNRRWDCGILIPGIVYSRNTYTYVPKEVKVYRVTNPFTKDDKIKLIQQALKDNGFDPGKIDGVYGYKTEAAVRAFQLSKGLVVDGEVGRITAKELNIKL